MFRLLIRRATVAVALLAFALSAFAYPLKPAYACSCLQPGPPAEALAASQVVFSGTVSAVAPGQNDVLVTFDVTQVWKGPDGPQLTLSTPSDSAGCGYEFAPGEAYLVYGIAQDGQLSTGLCTRTAPLAAAAADLAALGPGVAAPQVAPPPPAEVSVDLPLLPMAVGAVALAGAAAIALLAWRRRRGA